MGVSGNGSFKSSDLRKDSRLQVSPLVGYFISKNLAIGSQLILNHSTKSLSGNTIYEERGRSIHGLVRYYIGDWKVKPYLNLMAGYNRDIVFESSGFGFLVLTDFNKGMNASLGVGLAYFMSPKVALEAEANYQKYFYDDLDDSKISAVKLRMGISVYFK